MGGCYEKGRFQTNNYKYSTNSVQLKDDAVPHIFDFREHLYGKVMGKDCNRKNTWLSKLTKLSNLHVARMKRKYRS